MKGLERREILRPKSEMVYSLVRLENIVLETRDGMEELDMRILE